MIHQAHQHATADNVTEYYRHQITDETGLSNGIGGRAGVIESLEHYGEGDEVHVDDGVFKSGRHKRGYRKDYCHSLVDNASSGKRHPYRHTDENITLSISIKSRGKRALATPTVSTRAAISLGEKASKPKISVMVFFLVVLPSNV